jgi:hypothetical protein
MRKKNLKRKFRKRTLSIDFDYVDSSDDLTSATPSQIEEENIIKRSKLPRP